MLSAVSRVSSYLFSSGSEKKEQKSLKQDSKLNEFINNVMREFTEHYKRKIPAHEIKLCHNAIHYLYESLESVQSEKFLKGFCAAEYYCAYAVSSYVNFERAIIYMRWIWLKHAEYISKSWALNNIIDPYIYYDMVINDKKHINASIENSPLYKYIYGLALWRIAKNDSDSAKHEKAHRYFIEAIRLERDIKHFYVLDHAIRESVLEVLFEHCHQTTKDAAIKKIVLELLEMARVELGKRNYIKLNEILNIIYFPNSPIINKIKENEIAESKLLKKLEVIETELVETKKQMSVIRSKRSAKKMRRKAREIEAKKELEAKKSPEPKRVPYSAYLNDKKIKIPDSLAQDVKYLRAEYDDTRICGGYVRDKLLEIEDEKADKDILTGASEEMLYRAYSKERGYRIVDYYQKDDGFIYIIAKLDLVTNAEIYRFQVWVSPFLKPDVKDPYAADARARDFTINTFLSDENGNVASPIKRALSDLENKLLIVVNPHESKEEKAEDKHEVILSHAMLSFEKDPHRMLRAIYFEVKLHLTIANPVIEAICQQSKFLVEGKKNVSYLIGINSFIKKLFCNGMGTWYLKLMVKYQLIDKIFSILVPYLNHDKEGSPKSNIVLDKNLTDLLFRLNASPSLNYIYALLITFVVVQDKELAAESSKVRRECIMQDKINLLIKENPFFSVNFASFDEERRRALFDTVKDKNLDIFRRILPVLADTSSRVSPPRQLGSAALGVFAASEQKQASLPVYPAAPARVVNMGSRY